MKKTILILTVVFTAFLSSCNKDEDTPTPTQDAFIGTWKLESNDEIGVLTDCDKETTLVVTENNGIRTQYSIISTDGNETCEQNSLTNFTWENLGNNQYKFVIAPNDFVSEPTITFNENIMTIVFSGNTETYSKQ